MAHDSIRDSEANDKKPEGAAASQPAGRADRKSLGKYRIIRKIGEGGMGTVYLATDTQLDRTVALKILSQDKASNPTLTKRFESEARAAAQLRDDHIVLVYEAGEIEEHLYIALEYVEGVDVYNLVLRRGVLSVRRSIEIVKQVARALHHAYSKGIVHRDIKPSNLLITREGTVKLTDMGLARSIDETMETSITRDGTTVGTVDYMAPEQARDSRAADVRSDIYALGCTWYHMLAGAPPFPTGSLTSKLYAHATRARPDPRELNPKIPEGVVAVMHRMMERKMKDRYQTPEELLEALDHVDSLSDAASPAYLAALADVVEVGDADEVESRNSAAHQPPIPPRKRKRTQNKEAASRKQVDSRTVQYAAIAVAGIACLLALWWIATQFASALDSQPVQRDANPFAGSKAVSETKPPSAVAKAGKESSKPATKNVSASAVADASQGSIDDDSQERPSEIVVTEAPGPNTHNNGIALPASRWPYNIGQASRTPEELAKLPFGRKGERDYIPLWVADVRKPELDLAPSVTSDLPVITIGRIDGEPGKFVDLAAAIQALPESGGIIQLVGSGPFLLPPTRISGVKETVLTATGRDEPLIVFVPSADAEVGPHMTVSNGSIVFDRVHLAMLSKQFSPFGDTTLVQVEAGDLAVRDCSVTLVGQRDDRVTAFRIAGEPIATDGASSEASRVLLENVFTRGKNLTALALDGSPADVVASNCLFVNDDVPTVSVAGGATAPAVGGDSSEVQTRLQLFSCSLVAARNAFEYRPWGEPDGSMPIIVHSLNSIFAAAKSPGDGVLLSVLDWPAAGDKSSANASVLSLGWQTRDSLFLGWDHYVKDASASVRVSGPSAWQRFWGRTDPSDQFQQVYKASGFRIDDLGSVAPGQISKATDGVDVVTAADGGRPGCNVTNLRVPPARTLERASALAHRPVIPSGPMDGAHVAKTVEVHLARDVDLGALISQSRWPDNTLFVVFGSGLHRSSQMTVEDKSLYLRFVQTEGRDLEIYPRPVSSSRPDDGGAFILVRRGLVVVENGRFRIPASVRRAPVSRLLQIEDGSFALVNTILQGPMIDTPGYEGLIGWRRSKTTRSDQLSARLSGHYENFGWIDNCYLASHATIFDADMRDQAVAISNSVMVSIDTLFDLNILGHDPRIAGAIDIRGCTMSAADAFFKVRAAPMPQPAGEPLNLFVECTVFAPSVVAESGHSAKPVLIACFPSVVENGQLTWWGTANGFANEIDRLFTETEVPDSGEERLAFWQQAWGAGHVVRPVFEPSGTMMANVPTKPIDIDVGAFEIAESSQAFRWSADGRAIGADIESLKHIGPREAGDAVEEKREPQEDAEKRRSRPRRSF